MKSKEVIRNTILAYTNQIWGTKKIERLDLLVQMMIANLTNELYLMQNELDDIDSRLLDKIASKLTPDKFTTVRPAHTILHMKPNYSTITLEQTNTFTLEWFDNNADEEKSDAIIFHPIAELNLFDIKIDNILHNKTLYAIDSNHKRRVVKTSGQLLDNSIWLGLDINSDIENIKGLFFFIDFPKLSEIHELYGTLSNIECFVNRENVNLKQGLPILKTPILESDRDILQLYNDHFFYINQDIFVADCKLEIIPNELQNVITIEESESLQSKYWIKLQFPAYFTFDMLQYIDISINSFPISNRRLIETSIIKDNLSKVTTLFSERKEKLLTISSIIDTDGRVYYSDTAQVHKDLGTYHLETISPIFFEELELVDYVEQLLDLMEDERSAFTGINKDQVTQTLSILAKSTNDETLKPKVNYRSEEEEVVRLSINPYENTTIANVSYWVTHGQYINNIASAGRIYIPDKSSKLDGLLAVSLCEIHGGKEITDIQDIMSIDRYIFTSKDRIITSHDIKCFCESELGRAVETVTVRLGGKVSPKLKEGIIRVINIDLRPSKGNPDLLHQKGVLKSLKVRLQNRSPHDFIYEINIL